jgi:hypothetical protein
MIESLIGFILPPFIDLVNKYIANSNIRFVISLVLCLIVGGVAKAMSGQLDFSNVPAILTSAGVIFAEAQITYKLYWKDASLRNNATFINKNV